MAKEIIVHAEALPRMLAGLGKTARAVASTLGPSGPSVLIEHRAAGQPPIVSRDGVTVANAIQHADPVADLGARLLRDVAGAVSRQAGDGTTSATVMAECLARQVLKSVAAGAHPVRLKKGMDQACAAVVAELKAGAVPADDQAIVAQVAYTASGEASIGELFADVVRRLGRSGALELEMGHSRKDEFEVVEGARYGQGFLSPYFVTDKTRQVAELERPYVLMYEGEIERIDDLIQLYDSVTEAGRSLLVVADDVTGGALTTTLLNHVRGNIRVVAVKPPAFGDRRPLHLADLAVLTGGRVLRPTYGDCLARAQVADLGQAVRVVVDAESTTIIGGAGAADAIEQRQAALQRELQQLRDRSPGTGSPTGNLVDAEDLEARIGRLSGAIGVVRVGGSTDIEIQERLTRVRNAWASVSAAMTEGVVAGGGAGLLRCRRALQELVGADDDQQRGIEIVGIGLAAPARRIAVNAGLDPDQVEDRIVAGNGSGDFLDARTRSYANAFDAGVLDPVKVVRLGLQNAVGAVSLMLTAGAVVTEVRRSSFAPGFDPEWAAATRENPRAP